MDERKELCETCRFWERTGNHAGECRRYAPRPAMRALMILDSRQQDGREDAIFPIMSHDEWCGEWQAKS
jgi:hypothetical protein